MPRNLSQLLPGIRYGHRVAQTELANPFGLPFVNKYWWVDATNGSDSDTGESETEAFATVQKAIDSCSSFDWIQVLPGSYAENITTPLAGGARGVTLSGHYNGFRSENRTTLLGNGVADGDHILDVRAQGWRITGFRFAVAATSAAIRLRMTDATEAVGSQVASYTQIDNNFFWTNQDGIHSNGSNHNISIFNNEFQSNTGSAIKNTDTSIKAMANWTIKDNFFNGNTNDVILTGTITNNIVQDNNFNDSAATSILTFGTGAGNLVTRNAFGGTYSISGGYNAGGATNIWSGNYGVAAVTSGVPG